jgi:predicted RNase H-like HicB family nuclease
MMTPPSRTHPRIRVQNGTGVVPRLGNWEISDEEARGRWMVTRYLVVLERTDTGYSAYVPDLPGCIAAGETEEETLRLLREAAVSHVDAMRRDGEWVPAASARAGFVDV